MVKLGCGIYDGCCRKVFRIFLEANTVDQLMGKLDSSYPDSHTLYSSKDRKGVIKERVSGVSHTLWSHFLRETTSQLISLVHRANVAIRIQKAGRTHSSRECSVSTVGIISLKNHWVFSFQNTTYSARLLPINGTAEAEG